MITLRKTHERGRAQHGWLDSSHTFSIADSYDSAHMGVSMLGVLNEDRVRPDHGFPPHSHRDIGILTCVLSGALAQKDNLGNGSVIRPGEVQHMSAGTGITHSEYNAASTDLLHFLQIWLLLIKHGCHPVMSNGRFLKPLPVSTCTSSRPLMVVPGLSLFTRIHSCIR